MEVGETKEQALIRAGKEEFTSTLSDGDVFIVVVCYACFGVLIAT